MSTINLKKAIQSATFLFWLAVTVIPIIGIILSLVYPFSFYETQSEYRAFAQRYGAWSPLVFIGLQALQVIITPFSHYATGYMGGFLFGPLWGTIYNYVGRVLGHIIAFSLSRYLVASTIRRRIPGETVRKYDRLIGRRPAVLFLIYFLPLFPDDEISYLVGISNMPARWYLLANIFGQLGGSASLAYLGSGLDTHDPIFWILMIATLSGFPVLYVLARQNEATQETPCRRKNNDVG